MKVEPPVQFGEAGCQWPARPAGTPAEVRAMYVSHRIVAAVRRALGPGASFTDVAVRLGYATSGGSEAASSHPSDERRMRPRVSESDQQRVRRKMRGETPFSLQDVTEWCEAFDLNLSELTGGAATDPTCYPPPYRSILLVDEGRVRFRTPGQFDWTVVASALHRAVIADASLAPELVTGDVARMRLFTALTDAGLEPGLIRIGTDIPAATPALPQLTLLLGTTTPEVRVVAALWDHDALWTSVYETLASPLSEGVVVAVCGGVALSRIRVTFTGLLNTPVGNSYTVPMTAIEGLDLGVDDVLAANDWTVRAVIDSTGGAPAPDSADRIGTAVIVVERKRVKRVAADRVST